MSKKCYCQFCDKEMMAENMATMVQGYITCGSAKCTARAKQNTKDIAAEQAAIVGHKDRMVVFSTLTPEDDNTWRIIAQKNHPHALRDISVMSQMKLGHYVFDTESKLYYSAKTANEVIKQVQESVKEAE